MKQQQNSLLRLKKTIELQGLELSDRDWNNFQDFSSINSGFSQLLNTIISDLGNNNLYQQKDDKQESKQNDEEANDRTVALINNNIKATREMAEQTSIQIDNLYQSTCTIKEQQIEIAQTKLKVLNEQMQDLMEQESENLLSSPDPLSEENYQQEISLASKQERLNQEQWQQMSLQFTRFQGQYEDVLDYQKNSDYKITLSIVNLHQKKEAIIIEKIKDLLRNREITAAKGKGVAIMGNNNVKQLRKLRENFALSEFEGILLQIKEDSIKAIYNYLKTNVMVKDYIVYDIHAGQQQLQKKLKGKQTELIEDKLKQQLSQLQENLKTKQLKIFNQEVKTLEAKDSYQTIEEELINILARQQNRSNFLNQLMNEEFSQLKKEEQIFLGCKESLMTMQNYLEQQKNTLQKIEIFNNKKPTKIIDNQTDYLYEAIYNILAVYKLQEKTIASHSANALADQKVQLIFKEDLQNMIYKVLIGAQGNQQKMTKDLLSLQTYLCQNWVQFADMHQQQIVFKLQEEKSQQCMKTQQEITQEIKDLSKNLVRLQTDLEEKIKNEKEIQGIRERDIYVHMLLNRFPQPHK